MGRGKWLPGRGGAARCAKREEQIQKCSTKSFCQNTLLFRLLTDVVLVVVVAAGIVVVAVRCLEF